MKLHYKPWKPTKIHEKPRNYLEKPWKPATNHENTLKTMEINQKPWKTIKLP